MNQLEHGLYPFSETNLENFSRTLIDFSRSLDFTFNTFIPKISKSILPWVYIHFLKQILKTLLLELSRFSRLSRTFTHFPGNVKKIKFQDIPGCAGPIQSLRKVKRLSFLIRDKKIEDDTI